MTKTIKTLTFGTLLGTLLVSIGAVMAGGNNFKKAEAVCAHSGTHYTTKEATTKESGIREYWVCCKCHDHFLAYTDGEWVEGGKAANITDSNDDRYIPKTTEYTDEGFKVNSDGTAIISYNGKDTNVTIPEGITTIDTGAFKGSNITSVILPSTLTEIKEDAFKNTDNLSSIVIPGSVDEIAANAFLDDPNGLSYLFGAGRDITIYLEITKEEANAKFEKGWDNAGAQYILGNHVGDTKAKVYYKDQWHYDANGKPTPIN